MATGSDHQERVTKALSGDVPHLYANGFVSTISGGDMLLVLERNGQPEATVNLAFTAAKTLAISLLQSIAQLEQLGGRSIMTTHEIEQAFAESEKKESK